VQCFSHPLPFREMIRQHDHLLNFTHKTQQSARKCVVWPQAGCPAFSFSEDLSARPHSLIHHRVSVEVQEPALMQTACLAWYADRLSLAVPADSYPRGPTQLRIIAHSPDRLCFWRMCARSRTAQVATTAPVCKQVGAFMHIRPDWWLSKLLRRSAGSLINRMPLYPYRKGAYDS